MVIALGKDAVAAGIRPGMTLTQARALCAAVRHAEHEPQRDERALRALARWLMRFTPVACCSHDLEKISATVPRKQNAPAFALQSSKTPSPRPKSRWPGTKAARPKKRADASSSPRAHDHAIFLDLTGCERVFGGMEPLVAQIRQALWALRISATVAVAPTVGAAWALADSGKEGAIVDESRLFDALAGLSPASLRLSDDLVAALHHLGLSTIAQVRNLPRDLLPVRFGDELLRRLDQALGHIAEPLTPLDHPSPIEAKMDFDGPVASLEAIWAVIHYLLQQVVEQLARRGGGARRLDLQLWRDPAPPITRSISLSHPSRSAKSLFFLIQCAIEDLQREADPQAVATSRRFRSKTSSSRRPAHSHGPSCYIPDGYTALRLGISRWERASDEQIDLLDQERVAGQREVDRLIDRLALRLGDDAAVQVQLAQSHLPERAWIELKPGELRLAGPEGMIRGALTFNFLSPRPAFFAFSALAPPAPYINRPLRLFPCPAELAVMVTPSHDADGRPAAFVHDRQMHTVVHCRGPERIGGLWWQGHDKTRDYFEVEDPTGRRFWIFRVLETRKWYLHGSYQ